MGKRWLFAPPSKTVRACPRRNPRNPQPFLSRPTTATPRCWLSICQKLCLIYCASCSPTLGPWLRRRVSLKAMPNLEKATKAKPRPSLGQSADFLSLLIRTAIESPRLGAEIRAKRVAEKTGFVVWTRRRWSSDCVGMERNPFYLRVKVQVPALTPVFLTTCTSWA